MADDGKISADYASPNLRWALLLEDHPGATYGFELKKGTDIGIPATWGGEDDFCVATIRFPVWSQLSPVVATKAVSEVLHGERWVSRNNRRVKEAVEFEPSPELWNKLTTMTLGRALKRAGYPDDMPELKALIAWRKRIAEVQSLVGGVAKPELEAGPSPEEELGAAAKDDPDHVGVDDQSAPDKVEPEDEGVDDAELVDDAPTPGPDCPDHAPVQHRDGKPPWCPLCGLTEEGAKPQVSLDRAVKSMRALLGQLKAPEQKGIAEWAKSEAIAWPRPASVGDVLRVMEQIELFEQTRMKTDTSDYVDPSIDAEARAAAGVDKPKAAGVGK